MEILFTRPWGFFSLKSIPKNCIKQAIKDSFSFSKIWGNHCMVATQQHIFFLHRKRIDTPKSVWF